MSRDRAANFRPIVLAVVFALPASPVVADPPPGPPLTIYITNDNCPDYTWGLTEQQTRKAFADIVAAHLDLMKQTDGDGPADRDRYNLAVTQEALCFIEHYPQRREELIARIKEGRVYVSPFLCNSLWGFQGVEGFLRTLYPAARLEREWGIPRIEVAEHIEEPSLPWGVSTLLAGCSIRWLSVPFYNYDSTFGGLKTPPLFLMEGPDGSRLRVVMDSWACSKASYTQGANLLGDAGKNAREWAKHYEQIGRTYGARAVLASGTHGDISPASGAQAAGFAQRIKEYNARKDRAAQLANAALPDFCAAVDQVQKTSPFLPTVKGCFGHSWDLWPVCLAKYAAAMRQGERDLLAAETLIALAGLNDGRIAETTRGDRDRAQWRLAMLADHAWNGTDDNNRRHNAELRRNWSVELASITAKLLSQAWKSLGADGSGEGLVVFNPESFPRGGLVRLLLSDGAAAPAGAQVIREEGQDVAYLSVGTVPPFHVVELSKCSAGDNSSHVPPAGRVAATETSLESPFYRLTLDPRAGGVSRLLHKPSGTELVSDKGHGICRTIYFEGQEHLVTDATVRFVASGPFLARVEISGKAGDVTVRTLATVFADQDWVEFDVRLTKPVSTNPYRICQRFPVIAPASAIRAETTGAVIRPRPQPEGDLLPGADTRRLAVQGFADASAPGKGGVTVVPLDAFMLRLEEPGIVFEAMGNDQNPNEVIRDQHGETEFRFRYALRLHAGVYDDAETVRFSREAAVPLLVRRGRLPKPVACGIEVAPSRAVATCLKPAENEPDGAIILRIWEIAGKSGPLSIKVPQGAKVFITDLLERDPKQLLVKDGQIIIDLPAHGFAAFRVTR